MPLNRLLFFLFVLTLIGSLVYILYGPGTHTTESVTLTPKQYIERVQADRARQSANRTDSSGQTE